MRRVAGIVYGVVAYVIFIASFTYLVGFITGWVVNKDVNSGPVVGLAEALTVDLLLLLLFAVQHSGMARRRFKAWLTTFVPPEIERSTYVLAASLALILLLWQWRPIPILIWSVPAPEVVVALQALALAGALIILASTFMLNHLALFGLHQVVHGNTAAPAGAFQPVSFYKVVRHPMYFGFLLLIWLSPTMTVGHFLFAAFMTGYIFIGVWFEERDLQAAFGDEYRRYRARVAMVIPFIGGAPAPVPSHAAGEPTAAGAQRG